MIKNCKNRYKNLKIPIEYKEIVEKLKKIIMENKIYCTADLNNYLLNNKETEIHNFFIMYMQYVSKMLIDFYHTHDIKIEYMESKKNEYK